MIVGTTTTPMNKPRTFLRVLHLLFETKSRFWNYFQLAYGHPVRSLHWRQKNSRQGYWPCLTGSQMASGSRVSTILKARTNNVSEFPDIFRSSMMRVVRRGWVVSSTSRNPNHEPSLRDHGLSRESSRLVRIGVECSYDQNTRNP